ncbi:unnamed protein product [Vicia faba]|uniref:Fe2OG dioxygenase domain-containing protein n=1 Tax=Vicia faba TaxID=3906 RepID=A0AAV0YGJ0_VICFA|nr:unnamed protein product [Vicia faba]
MGEIHSAYILSTEPRPNSHHRPLTNEPKKTSSQKWGFFHIINHGVSSDLINKVANETKKLFELRIQYPSNDDPNDLDLWTLKNHWPQSLPHFRETIAEYGAKLEKLSLELISLSLGLPGDKFFDCFENQLSLVRLNYYPPCPSPDLALGIGPHKDPCVLTIVAQDDTGGLQVKNNSVGGWVPIEPIPGALVVNVGDVFQVWSNDKYDSAIHRATVNSQKERYSYPFFFFPGHDIMVQPAEELVSEKDPAKYKPYNFGKYYSNRTRHDFNKEKVAGKEIHDFKISD